MTAQYTYLATNLVSGTILGELPVNNVSLDSQLNSAGHMSAGMRMDDPRVDNVELLARTTPGKTAFWAYRENQIVWGGIMLTREYQSSGKSLTLTGQTFECYASKRFPRSVIGTAVQNLSMGQCAMIDYLWQQLQSIPHGTIGVVPANVPMVDPTTTLSINGWDLSTSYSDLINRVTTLNAGPDWTIVWNQDGSGNPYAQLVVGAPIGNPVGATDLVVDYPGPIANYVYTENASSGNNQWWSSGDGTGTTQLTGLATDSNSLSSGYPLYEGVNSYSGVTNQVTADAHASADLKNYPMALITHAVQLKGDVFPQFGSYGLGDYVVCNVTDPRFSTGSVFKVRAVGWSVQPPDEGQGTEKVQLVFDEATGGG